MPNVRKGLLNQKKKAKKELETTDVDAVVKKSKKAKTLSELQEAVNELGLLVVKLTQALGMMGEV